MDRYQFEDLISDYIENNLSISLRKEFETYLDNHPSAKEQIISVKHLMDSMKSLPIVKTSDSFTGNLTKRITVVNSRKSVAKNNSFIRWIYTSYGRIICGGCYCSFNAGF